MMKNFLLFVFALFVSMQLAAQQRDITINWSGKLGQKKTVFAQKEQQTINKKNLLASVNLEVTNDDIVYTEQWEESFYINENTVSVSNLIFENLTASELLKLNKNLVPSELSYSLKSTRARNRQVSVFSITPIINDNGVYKRVVSLTVAYQANRSFNGGQRIAVVNSVLSEGEWFKFRVDKTGVQRLDKDFLEDLGMNLDGKDPRTLKIYGNGGKALPLLNAENTIFDLPENAIQVIGEEDGVFNSGDELLFYGTSALGYDSENDTNINPYSDQSYYYVTIGGTSGKRVQPMVEPSGAANVTITTFNDYQFFEEDDFSPVKVGRRWYGNRFDIESEQSYEFTFPNIVSGAQMSVKVNAAAASETVTSMAISVNGTNVDPLNFNPINDPFLLSAREYVGEIPQSGETVTVNLLYNNSGNPSSVGYLDYISIEAIRNLIGVDDQLLFQYNNAATLTGIGEYQLTNASQYSQVWDVTNPYFVTSKQNDGGATVSFKANLGEIRKYIAVHPNRLIEPVRISNSRVANQDLKGTIFNNASGSFQDLDYVIITAPFLIQPALRLASLHKSINGYHVKVVTTDKIYEEFSSGKQDIGAIRNFIRYIYENASSPDKRIKYVGFLGDASVDYKDRLSGNNNIVPTFQSLNSFSTSGSFMSDDYFGSLDINEGTIGSGSGDIDKLDVAVGRILADDVPLANAMVDKIEQYLSKESFGNWRNNFVLISDDVDEAWEHERIQVQLDALGDVISDEKPFINVKKIHSDAYQQQTSAGGNRYPDVNEAIKNNIDVGALVINYFGHGGEDGLAKEFIYTKNIARELRNTYRYPCIITVTCEFTKFDNPLRPTAGEFTFWNTEGGAISLVTTTRSISVGLGVEFNQLLAEELFGFGVDIPVTPAEAIRRAKNDISNSKRRVVFYIGDPALNLAFPKKDIRLTTINGQPLGQANTVLQALSRVTLGGEVLSENGTLLQGYSGVLEAKVFDKKIQRSTLGNDGVRENGELLILDFETLGEVIFNGQATVVNGRFEFDFVVPRDIQIPVGEGRVSFYAQKNGALEDQAGHSYAIRVGGLNEDAPADNTGPQIQLFMNDESFVSGGITNDSPILIAKLQDENGINTASGIGHDIVAILDGDESNPFIINDYYQADVDNYMQGRVSFKLRDLEEGVHTLTLKAWDVYNNSSTSEIQFTVAGDNSLEITRVLNYPNPFVNYTEFWFNHNRPFEPLEVQVQVFTVTGKVVWSTNQIVTTDGFLSREIVWDGRDDFGDKIGKGVYVYKITVTSTLTNNQVEKYEKLVIL